jgi:hypothetical protein
MSRKRNEVSFNTCIITYASNYNEQLSIGLIAEKLDSLIKDKTTKVVIAREDPDDKIQRIHFHVYWDSKKQKTCTTKYFDVELRSPVIVIIHNDEKSTREYILWEEISNKLSISSPDDPQLGQYINENYSNVDKFDYLTHAHPNIELKKEYGDKYCMLKYVVKQKLVVLTNFKIEEELKYLEENKGMLIEKSIELTNQGMIKELNIETIDELIELGKKYVIKLKNKNKKKKSKGKSLTQTQNNILEKEQRFCEKLRQLIYFTKGITKREVMNIIEQDDDYSYIYHSKYLNYNKLINDSFKNKPQNKPTRNYELKFWLPNKLYEYIKWLDEWVKNWTTGEKNKCEHRPKGLVLIGPSRSGKTTLMSLIGDFSYFKNIWSSDNWEYIPPYTIMDDMDAQDEGKGLSFSWFKPWFGAQDCMTITDKYKPKEDIQNGKPLIWLNNFDITETFKSESAQDYIRRNMVYINLGNRNLFTEPTGMEIYNYTLFDPKETWYYNNIYLKKEEESISIESTDDENNNKFIKINNVIEIKCIQCGGIDYIKEDDKENWSCYFCKNPEERLSINIIDETESVKKRYEDLKRQRIEENEELGRPSKRNRSKNRSNNRSN